MGRRRTGRVGLDDHRPVRRGLISARDPPPHWGVHHRRGSRGRGTISKVTDAVRRCRHGVAAPASGWPSTRRVHRGRDPRRWSAPATGCRGRPNPHRRGRGAWTASSTWLKDLDPGRGGGLLEGRRVCARSGQQGGARGVLIVCCCDGPAGLPEAARGGPGPTPWSPPAWSTPVRATRAVRRLRGPQGGRRRRAPEPAPPPTRRPPDGPRAPSASPTRGCEHPQTAAGAGEGLGEEHRLPGLPPGPAPGHLCTTNAVRVAQPPNRAVRREARPLSPPTRRRPELLWPAGLQHPRGRRAAERAKEKNTPAHSRRAKGRLVEGQVTTNWKQALAQLAAAYPDRINPHL